VSDHLTRKELKQDKVRETLEHGAEAVASHSRLSAIIVLAIIVAGSAYLGWNYYSKHQEAQAQSMLDEGLKIFNAPLVAAGRVVPPGELTYADATKRAQDAEVKFIAAANAYPSTRAGRLARYYSALCLMDLERVNQAGEELAKLDAGPDKELAALANYQRALIAERSGKQADAVKILKDLSNANSVLVPKPLVMLELAGVLKTTEPAEAQKLYEQLKKDYPNSRFVEEADRGLQSIAPKS